jgi:RiboL-PSP-HEPN
MPTVYMTDTFEKNSEIFRSNTDAAYDECASGIANLDKIIVSVSSGFSSMTRGYLLPIIYAYWERFFRIVFSEYLRCVELSNLNLISIHPQLAQLRLKKEISDTLRKHGIKQLQETASSLSIETAKTFFDNLNVIFQRPVTFADPSNLVETESNVNFTVLQKNCKNMGIDIETVKTQLEESAITLSTVLKELVDVRNQISHGDTFKAIRSDEWESLKNSILSVMTAVQLELYETLRQGRCLK